MLNIKRIFVKAGEERSEERMKAYRFVKDEMKRRWGNSVTFCFEWEVEEFIDELKEAGFEAYDDDFKIRLNEPEDFEVGKDVYLEGMLGNIKMVVKEKAQVDGKDAVRVKYADRPRKKGVWVRPVTQAEVDEQIKEKYGEGMLTAYWMGCEGHG